MGILSRLFSKSAAPRVVTVKFRSLLDPWDLPAVGTGYTYLWPFDEEPQVGDWAIAPGNDGPATVVVVSLGRTPESAGMRLKALTRLVPQAEIERAHGPIKDNAIAHLEHARALLGLAPLNTRVRPKAARGLAPLVPPEGEASAPEANARGDAWGEASKLALRMGRPQEEADTFKDAARYWWRLRDRVARQDRDKAAEREIQRIDVPAIVRAVNSRPASEIGTYQLAGKAMADWLDIVQKLEKVGRGEEALALAEALVTAAEQEAVRGAVAPAPAYTERLAILLRKRKDYDAEVRVLERWERAIPPSRGAMGSSSEKLLARLARARELASKAK